MNNFTKLCLVALAMLSTTVMAQKNKYLEFIPGNSLGVMSIDAQSVHEKMSGAYPEILQLIMEKKGTADESEKLLTELFAFPASTGISLSQPMMLYMTKAGDANFMMAVTDRAKVEAIINKFLKLNKSDLKLKTLKGVSYVTTEYSGSLVLTNDVLITTSSKVDPLTLLDVKSENQLINNPSFAKFTQNQKDLNFWISGENIVNEMSDLLGFIYPEEVVAMYKGYNMAIYVDSQVGVVNTTAEVDFSNPQAKEMWDKAQFPFGAIQGTFLNKIPQGTLFNAGMNIKNIASLFPLFDAIPQWTEMIDRTNKELDIDIQKLLATIDGDVHFSILDFPSGEMAWALFIETTDNYILTSSVAALKKAGSEPRKISDNFYYLPITEKSEYRPQPQGMWAIYNDGKTVFCTDSTLITNYSKGMEPSFLKENIAKEFIMNQSAMSFSVDNLIKSLPIFENSNDEMVLFMKLFQDMTLTTKGLKSEFKVNLHNKQMNAISVMVIELIKIGREYDARMEANRYKFEVIESDSLAHEDGMVQISDPRMQEEESSVSYIKKR